MIGLVSTENTTTGRADNKKLFQYLKNSRTDQQGIPPLSQNGLLHSDTTEKADILNQQFQSVFTPLSPLSLRDLSIMKVQDLVDDKVLPKSAIPKDLRNPIPVMSDINISETGLLNLLRNLKPKKAAGPDRIKHVVLQELREEFVPMLKVLFERSLKSSAVPHIWNSANVSPIFKKVKNQLLLIIGPSPLHISCVR